MRRLLGRRQPSPAMAVAFVALLAALSGTAIALPGKNSVDSGDIKNNAVKTKDIKNNDVRSRDVRNGALTGGDIKDDSLTGADINENTLAQVPSANTANSANSAGTADSANTIGGLVVRKVFAMVPRDGPIATVFDVGGLKLTLDCAGGLLNLDASSAVEHAVIATNANESGTPGGTRTSDLGPSSSENPISGLARGQVTINYVRRTGEVVTAMLSVDDSHTFGDASTGFDGCAVAGVVIASG